jgi:hypothetical protein
MTTRRVTRLASAGLAFAFCAATWYALAGAQTPAPQNSNRAAANTNAAGTAATNAETDARAFTKLTGDMTPVGNANASGVAAPDESGTPQQEAADSEPPTVAWGEVKPVWGFANASSVTLLSAPDASSSVVATFEPGDYAGAEILDSTRGFLRVRFRDEGEGGAKERAREGWVEWGAVVPHASAVVLDAGSGEVVGRVPLEEGATSVSFSPDGKRAVFYGTAEMAAYDGVSTAAVEVETEGFRRVRALETTAAEGFAALFYDPSGGALHALAHRLHLNKNGAGNNAKLYRFLVADERAEAADGGAAHDASGTLALAPGGTKALLIHNAGEAAERVAVDVLDLKTLDRVGSFEVRSEAPTEWAYEYAVGPDAATFYYVDRSDGDRIVAVNTRTGERVGEYPLRVVGGQYTSFSQQSLVGDSLLVRVWRPTDEEGEADHSEPEADSFWLKPDGKAARAESDVAYAVEAGDARYAVNDDGTLLLKLGADGRVRERLKIERPDAKYGESMTTDLTVLRFAAGPDGKYLVIFFGMLDGC